MFEVWWGILVLYYRLIVEFARETIFGRPFVKRFALCYQTPLSVCPVLFVTLASCGQTV